MLEHEDEVLSVAEAALQNTMDPYESQFFEDIQVRNNWTFLFFAYYNIL